MLATLRKLAFDLPMDHDDSRRALVLSLLLIVVRAFVILALFGLFYRSVAPPIPR